MIAKVCVGGKKRSGREIYRVAFLQIPPVNLSLRHFSQNRSVRLGVRTPDFHSGNTGSIPVQTTTKADRPERISIKIWIPPGLSLWCPEATDEGGLLQGIARKT